MMILGYICMALVLLGLFFGVAGFAVYRSRKKQAREYRRFEEENSFWSLHHQWSASLPTTPDTAGHDLYEILIQAPGHMKLEDSLGSLGELFEHYDERITEALGQQAPKRDILEEAYRELLEEVHELRARIDGDN